MADEIVNLTPDKPLTPQQIAGWWMARTVWPREGERVWRCPSESKTRRSYEVDVVAWTCTCKWFTLNLGKPCKHIECVRYKQAANAGLIKLPPPPAHKEEVERRKRPRHPQNDQAYNDAKRNEWQHFLPILYTLCESEGLCVPAFLDDNRPEKRGRQPLLLSDIIIANCLRFRRRETSRPMKEEYERLHAEKWLSRPVHDNSVLNYMQDERLIPVLERLITASARPLIPHERFFAADSSAFSGDRFVRWYDFKQGRVFSHHEWVKLQMMCGVATHVITASFVLHEDGPDGPHMKKLVERTAAGGFEMEEVSADKGYSSVEAHDIISVFGARPYIAFKRVATGWSGGVFQQQYQMYEDYPDEFLTHYHRRSNAETVFSMVEREFGKYLASRRPLSMEIEVLFKLLCHNIIVLIREMYEGTLKEIRFRGLLATTLKNDPAPIIRFPGA